MTPPNINIKRHAESQREVQIKVSLKRSCHFSFLFYLNCNIIIFNNQENSTVFQFWSLICFMKNAEKFRTHFSIS